MPSISFIVPALDEEANLEATVLCIEEIVPKYFSTWEILIFNDGSTDNTPKIADRLKASRSNIRVFHHTTPKNLGFCYQKGIAEAAMEYVIMIPADNECREEVMHPIFSSVGQAQLINPVVVNHRERKGSRRFISSLYTQLINLISGCRLAYYNGPVLHETKLVRKFGIRTHSFSYQTDLLIRMVRAKLTMKEVNVSIHYRTEGRSKAFRFRNILQVLAFLKKTFIESRFQT